MKQIYITPEIEKVTQTKQYCLLLGSLIDENNKATVTEKDIDTSGNLEPEGIECDFTF